MQALDAGIYYCAIRYTCAYKFTARVKSTARKECARFAYKMADNRKYGNAIAIFETRPLYEKPPNLNTSEHYTETASMPTLSLSCVSCR